MLTQIDTRDDELLAYKVKSLVLDAVHNIDVVKQLIQSRVTSLDNWVWHKQLQFSIDAKTSRCKVRMAGATFDYTYEYQGIEFKLIFFFISLCAFL